MSSISSRSLTCSTAPLAVFKFPLPAPTAGWLQHLSDLLILGRKDPKSFLSRCQTHSSPQLDFLVGTQAEKGCLWLVFRPVLSAVALPGSVGLSGGCQVWTHMLQVVPSILRGGTKIPSVPEAEERIVSVFHGKTTQTITPPPTISRVAFLVKASVFSPFAQHEVLFHPLLLPVPTGPARQQKCGFLWKWPFHTGFKAIAGNPQSGDTIPAPACLIWLSGLLSCVHSAPLIMITLVLVTCPARVEP